MRLPGPHQLLFGLFICCAAGQQSANAEPRAALLTPATESAVRTTSDDATVMRKRPVHISRALDRPGDLMTPIAFNLFDDTVLYGTIREAKTASPMSSIVSGTLEGMKDGTFTLVVQDGVVIGNIRAPGTGSFQIRYIGNGVHVVKQIDESQFPPCGTDHQSPLDHPPPHADPARATGTCDDDGSTIDLFVAYTADARAAQGGTAAMQALIALSEAETNQAYANSLIATTQVRVVMTHEVDYVESGDSATDRARLSDPVDGSMDEVIDLRDQLGADVVMLVLNQLEVCGRAFFSISAGDVPHPELGFNVVRADCSAGNFTFGHELGHNQGCRHDRLHDSSDDGAFLYSHGYIEPTNAFRTVMGVKTSGVPRIQYFSTPDVSVDGLPIGIADGDPASADNARTIAETAYNVANFRRSNDCNANGVCDDVELGSGTARDCNANGLPDDCDGDCNENGLADECDLDDGTSLDCTGNGIPDECEPDCNTNGIADSCDVQDGTSIDENGNGRPDECEPPILYVDVGADGADNGRSWLDAFESPHDAFLLAAESHGAVQEIWIAQGIYTPAEPNGDHLVSFELPRGVGVYGGFSGTESDRSQRDAQANPTVFTGDLNGDDGPDFTNYEENSRHVVSAIDPQIETDTILDGFTVTGGYAPSGLIGSTKISGAGLIIIDADPTIQNCLFTKNAAYGGAGIYVYARSNPTIARCRFIENQAQNQGAGLAANTGFVVRRGRLNATVRDCIFLDNHGANTGSAVNATLGAFVTLSHCTLVDNRPSSGYGGLIAALIQSELRLEGCILHDTQEQPQVTLYGKDESALFVSNSIIIGGTSLVSLTEASTLHWGLGNMAVNPGLSPDRIHLLPQAPASQRGAMDRTPEELDIDGESRVRFCRADIGADEADSFNDCNANGAADACDIAQGDSQDANENGVPDECDTHQTIHVDEDNCPGPGSGTSTDPYCDIQTAINAASQDPQLVVTVLVNDGLYTGPNNRDIDFAGRAMTLRCVTGPSSCQIDPEGLGRGFHFHSGELSNSVLDGFTITGGSADAGGAMLISGASPKIRNCTVEQSSATTGGGLQIGTFASPTFTGCAIVDNDAVFGGGVYVEANATPTLENSSITGNNADIGGGVYFDATAAPTLDGCLIAGNEADTGGGVHSDGASAAISGCTIEGNVAVTGGGIHIQGDASPALSDCSVIDNEAGVGGGIAIVNSDARIDQCTIRGNRSVASSVANGGGAWLIESEAVLTGCVIEDNTVAAPDTGYGFGGGVYASRGTPRLEECVFRGNTAGGPGNTTVHDRQGGGLYLDRTPAGTLIRHCTFTRNAARRGAAVMLNAADPTFESCVFDDNAASFGTYRAEGGGVYALNADAWFDNCTFTRNQAQTGGGIGGGVANINGVLHFDQCAFAGNVATNRGGAVFSQTVGSTYNLNLTNCTVYGNTAEQGGGLFVEASNNGLHILNLANSIVWNNIADESPEANQLGTSCGCVYNLSHNCVEGWTGSFGGVGNIGMDPLFVDPDGPDDLPGTLDDNLHVHGGSPVIDAGDNTAVGTRLTTDFEGNPRFADDPSASDTGVGPAPIIDMGLFEGGKDCNFNGIPDPEDVASGTSEDCTGNGIPDECEPDCNSSGTADSCDIAAGASLDCNTNFVPDECDLIQSTSADCNENGAPDECEPDDDEDGIIDDCDGCPTDPDKIEPGVCGCLVPDQDTDFDTVPDCLDQCPGFNDLQDSDFDTVADGCDVCENFDDLADADVDTIPDGCDQCPGFDDRADLDGDGVPDACDLCAGFDDTLDCNNNLVPDGCDVVDETSADRDDDGIPDECNAPVAAVSASRYITWTPLAGDLAVALRVTAANDPCLNHYVDFETDPLLIAAGIGKLVDDPVFHTPDTWQTLHVRDYRILAGHEYSLWKETMIGQTVVESTGEDVATWLLGDVDGNGVADFLDIADTVTGFLGAFEPPVSHRSTDLHPCLPDGVIDFRDISSAVDGFLEKPDECMVACPE